MQTRHPKATACIDALRRGMPIRFDSSRTLFAAEFLSRSQLENLPQMRILLLTGSRARSLGYDGEAAAVSMDVSQLSDKEIIALANPLYKHLPAEIPVCVPASQEDAWLLMLAKHASLLPALLLLKMSLDTCNITAEQLAAYAEDTSVNVRETARANLPIDVAEQTQIITYRGDGNTSEHLALLIGSPQKQTVPLVRVHSSCTTGDLLGSLRCDCGNQLHAALEQMAEAEHGVLIYLHQEGRGIGITNKIRAYALQEEGLDTYDANTALGYDEDERDFALAAAILKELNIPSINLLTNNPAKIRGLEKHSIAVALRTPLKAGAGKHNHAYLEAKAKKSGHLF